MSIILSFLFSSVLRNALFESKVASVRSSFLAHQHVQTRVQDLLLSVQHNQHPALYTQQFPEEKTKSLIILFDNGIDPDPAFSGTILGKIFLDSMHNLSLATWPLDIKTNRAWRTEVLLPDVEDFRFEFFGAHKITQRDHDVTEQTDEGEKMLSNPKTPSVKSPHFVWSDEWSKTQKILPSIIHLHVVQKKKNLSFAFFPPSVEPIATYIPNVSQKLANRLRQSLGIEITEERGCIAEIQPLSSVTQSRELSLRPIGQLLTHVRYTTETHV